MKTTIKLFTLALLSTLFTLNVNAQDKDSTQKIKTAEFTVTGVCGMCKKRIEKAAKIEGVKFAQWYKKEQTLKVVFETEVVEEKAIHEAVAKAGHDTEDVKATEEAYSELPKCCGYRDGVEIH